MAIRRVLRGSKGPLFHSTRLAHTGEDSTQKLTAMLGDHHKFHETGQDSSLAIANGFAAVSYVRQHASEWGVSPDRVGIIGFSAGGAIAAGVAFRYKPEGRPAFVAPIYPGGEDFKDAVVPADAPSMFIVAVADDQLGLVLESAALYQKWTAATNRPNSASTPRAATAFGMRKHNLPTDHWSDRLADWLELEGWLKK